MIMLSLVYPYPNERMHILFCFLVATATFYSFPAFARPPSPAFEFQERPPLKQVLIEPEFSNLFTPTTEQTVSVASPFSFTGDFFFRRNFNCSLRSRQSTSLRQSWTITSRWQ